MGESLVAILANLAGILLWLGRTTDARVIDLAARYLAQQGIQTPDDLEARVNAVANSQGVERRRPGGWFITCTCGHVFGVPFFQLIRKDPNDHAWEAEALIPDHDHAGGRCACVGQKRQAAWRTA